MAEPVEALNFIPLEESYIQLVENLARLQRETQAFFTMPPVFTQRDAKELTDAVALLDGRGITLTWKTAEFALQVADPKRFMEEVNSKAAGAAFMAEGRRDATIAGHTVPLGRTRTYFPAARITNVEEVREVVEAAAPGSELTVELALEALGDKTARIALLPE